MEFSNRLTAGMRALADVDTLRNKYRRILIRGPIVALLVITITFWTFSFSQPPRPANPDHHHTSRSPLPVKAKLISPGRDGDEDATFDIDEVQNLLPTLDQANPQLIKYVRHRYLTPPSKLPYALADDAVQVTEIDKWVLKFFNNKQSGIFIEAGAHDGGKWSHSLYFEKELGWTGLLIECNPLVAPYLYSKHRKAWIANLCLGPTKTPGMMQFSNPTTWSYSGKLGGVDGSLKQMNWTFFDVQTMPLFTILAALKYTEVDYFYFDIQSFELPVLRNFPFDKVTFKVLSVEVQMYSPMEKKELRNLLTSNSYIFVKGFDGDHLYVHRSQSAFLSIT